MLLVLVVLEELLVEDIVARPPSIPLAKAYPFLADKRGII
jgi:hypothetical protein